MVENGEPADGARHEPTIADLEMQAVDVVTHAFGKNRRRVRSATSRTL